MFHQKRQSLRPYVSIVTLFLSITGTLLIMPFSNISSNARNPNEYTRRFRLPFLDIFSTPSPFIPVSSFSRVMENVVSMAEILFFERSASSTLTPSYTGISTRGAAHENNNKKVLIKNSLDTAFNIFYPYYLQSEIIFYFF